jgi:hypothetical protein
MVSEGIGDGIITWAKEDGSEGAGKDIIVDGDAVDGSSELTSGNAQVG